MLGLFTFSFNFEYIKFVLPIGFIIYLLFMKNKERKNNIIKKKATVFGFIILCLVGINSIIYNKVEYRDRVIPMESISMDSLKNNYKILKKELGIDNQAFIEKLDLDYNKNKIKMIQTSSIIANIDTQTITKNNKYINSIINIPIIMIDNKDISKNINDEITNSIMKFFNDSQKQAKEYNDALSEVENKFVANVDFDVKKNSDNILSILIKYYKYAGGAHGYYENVAYNIDIRNGNFLTIDNLFKEGSDYKNIINEEIRNQIEELIKLDEQNKGVYEFKSIEDKQKFYIQDDNIVVYFDLYDIAPYAAGIPEFIINVNKIDHILKPEYKEIFK